MEDLEAVRRGTNCFFATDWGERQLFKFIRSDGAPGGTRTPDPLLRRQTLYPTELRAHLQL